MRLFFRSVTTLDLTESDFFMVNVCFIKMVLLFSIQILLCFFDSQMSRKTEHTKRNIWSVRGIHITTVYPSCLLVLLQYLRRPTYHGGLTQLVYVRFDLCEEIYYL